MKKASRPTIILPIETKVREFHGKLYFAYMAARCRYQVYIGEQGRMWKYANLFPQGTYIDKSIASTRVNWFEQLKESGHKIVSWDEEGLLFFSSEMYKKLRLDEKALRMVEHFFCWGDVQRQVVASYHPEFSEKLHICGNPRFDLLRTDRRQIYSDAAARLRARYGKIILINTNFAFCNHFRTEEELHAMLQAYPLASEPGYIDGWIAYQRQGFAAFCHIVPEIAGRYPEHTIIVRPHPSENHGAWREIAKSSPNIEVNAEGNVHEWIMTSDVLLHDNCTTAVEAYILGVPAISYRQGQNPKYENALPKALSYRVEEQQELYEVLDLAIDKDEELYGRIWNQERQTILEKYVSGMTGRTSVEAMLVRMADTVRSAGQQIPLSKKIENKAKISWRKVLHRYRDYRNPPDGYSLQKFPGISQEEITQTLVELDRVLGFSTAFAVKKVVKDIYLILAN